VGMSGAGKTTLMELLPRFHDVTAGRITLDGRDLRTVTVGSLRGLIGIVTQDTFLFHDSIEYNIAYGRPRAPPEGLRHPGGAGGGKPPGRPAPAPRHGARVPQGPADPHPGRGHVRPR